MLRLICLSCTFIFLMACESSNTSTANKEKAAISEAPTKLILVNGVTGRQGGAVARALLERGYKVRGLTRNPMSDRAQRMSDLGVIVVKGDFEDIASLETALENVHGVFLVTNFWEHGYEAEVQQGKNVVDAARKANVRHLVFSSVANSDQSTGIPHFDSKYEIEQYIRAADIAFTILRPVSFMENWEYSRESILAGKISSPFSTTTRMQQISVRDIGRFVALAFAEPQYWTGKTLDIAGDEYTVSEVIKLFSAVTGSRVKYVHVPWDVYEKSAGREMTIMDRWIDGVGYSANIKLVRSKLAGMMTLEEYLTEAGW